MTWGKEYCREKVLPVYVFESLCKEKNIDAHTYTFSSKTEEKGHAVTIGTDNGQMWMSSNGSHEDIQSVDDAKDKIARRFGWWFDDIVVQKIDQTRTGVKNSSSEQYKAIDNIASLKPETKDKTVLKPLREESFRIRKTGRIRHIKRVKK